MGNKKPVNIFTGITQFNNQNSLLILYQ